MGFKLRGVIRCGRCGKPRGVRHTCVSSRARRRRHKLQNPVTWECPTCRKPRGLRHTCVIRTDFKQRKRAAARQRATAERRKRRQLTAAKRRLRRELAAAGRRARAKGRPSAPKRSARPRADSHVPEACADPDCQRYGCKKYREGWAAGHASGYSAGHDDAEAEAGSGDDDGGD